MENLNEKKVPNDVTFMCSKNQYGYDKRQLSIDYDNKTYKVGPQKWASKSDIYTDKQISAKIDELKEKGFKEIITEGLVYTVDSEVSDDITVEVGKEYTEKTKVDNNQSFEDFKKLYDGKIKDKCMADYGTIEDEKLLADTAKELYITSQEYVPGEDTKITGDLEDKKKITERVQKTVTVEDVLKELGMDIDSPAAKSEKSLIQEMIEDHPYHTAEQVAEGYNSYVETGYYELAFDEKLEESSDKIIRFVISSNVWGTVDNDSTFEQDTDLLETQCNYYDLDCEEFFDKVSSDNLAQYISEDSPLYGKVKKIFIKLDPNEIRTNAIIEAEECVKSKPELIKELQDYLTGQYSDGWGEGFEQKPVHTFRATIDTDYGEEEVEHRLYINTWSRGDMDFVVETLEESVKIEEAEEVIEDTSATATQIKQTKLDNFKADEDSIEKAILGLDLLTPEAEAIKTDIFELFNSKCVEVEKDVFGVKFEESKNTLSLDPNYNRQKSLLDSILWWIDIHINPSDYKSMLTKVGITEENMEDINTIPETELDEKIEQALCWVEDHINKDDRTQTYREQFNLSNAELRKYGFDEDQIEELTESKLKESKMSEKHLEKQEKINDGTAEKGQVPSGEPINPNKHTDGFKPTKRKIQKSDSENDN